MIHLYSRDLPWAVACYSELGFVEVFRTRILADRRTLNSIGLTILMLR